MVVRTEPIYEVFVASPNDVKPERHILRDVIRQIDDGYTDVSLRPIMWESDAFRDFSLSDTQAELNVRVHQCDLLVAVFGGTLGTPTDRAASGAIEEIQESNQNVLLFLKDGNVEYLRRELGSHFPKMANRLYHTYVGEDDFRKEAFRQISRWFNKTLQESVPTNRDESQAEREEPSNGLGRGTGLESQPRSVSSESPESVTTARATLDQVVQHPVSSQRARKNVRGSVADLLREGLLAAGARVICEPRHGVQYTATVLASGDIQLPDGRTFNSLSAAGRAVAGRNFSGWSGWWTEDGRTLYELRSELQFASDRQTQTTGAVPQTESVDPVSSETGTEATLTAAVSPPTAPRKRTLRKFRGTIADLLNQGLLAAGAQIIWEPVEGERYTATVLASGDIQLPDGRTFSSPSTAAQQASGRAAVSGWERWRTEDDRTLYELRSELQFASDRQTQTTGAVPQTESVDPVSSETGTEATPEQVVQQPVSSQPTRKLVRGSVADLLREGLLAAGAQIIYEPVEGERYTATVLASGDIQLPDGRTFNNLSAAGEAVAARKFSGWQGWRTDDGRTLHELRSELQFASRIRRKTIRGSVADLLREGLLTAGAQIICEPRLGEQHTATVLASGDIQLPDGRTFNNLSAAGRAVAGRIVRGWKEWRTDDGRTLHELRSKLGE